MAASLKKTQNKTKPRLAPLNKKCASQPEIHSKRTPKSNVTSFFNPFTPSSVQSKNSKKNFIFANFAKQIAPCKRTAKEISFECHTIGFRPQTQKSELLYMSP